MGVLSPVLRASAFLGDLPLPTESSSSLGRRKVSAVRFSASKWKPAVAVCWGLHCKWPLQDPQGLGWPSLYWQHLSGCRCGACLHGCIFSPQPQTLLPTAPGGLSSDLESNYQVFLGQEDTFFPSPQYSLLSDIYTPIIKMKIWN